ncbi:MAG TPA: hypothetical protein VG186_13920 [Solirubrobacteraceae bacterium]|jgi:hypothetical protein|nr:hypothetical protein [Solirubrobacteraceae bacterium]
MSEFVVTPEDVIAASGRLSAIRVGVQELCGYVRGCAGAAAGTPAEAAVEDLLRSFAAVLPHFGLAGEHLGGAVAGAGAGYARTDSEVAAASDAVGGE